MSVQQLDLFGNVINFNVTVEFPQETKDGAAPRGAQKRVPHFTIGRDDWFTLFPKGQKGKFLANLEAIQYAKAIIQAGGEATDEDRLKLLRYGGWGNLSEVAFDTMSGERKQWSSLQESLQKWLTADEYAEARASTNNAHYTQPLIAAFIWDVLEVMGYQGGHVLEPAIGSGIFLATAPPSVTNTGNFFASEKDLITAQIAKLIWPGADIRAKPLESVGWDEESFDLVIGNWPFSPIGVHDPQLYSNGLSDLSDAPLHDYFFLKALTLVREGGLIAAITSRFTMDKKDHSYRQAFGELGGKLVMAIRLPVTAHQKFAGTEVTTDILFIQRTADKHFWPEVTDAEYSSYFVDNPAHMLGTMEVTGGRFANALECVPPKNFDLSSALYDLAETITPHDIYTPQEPKKGLIPQNSNGTAFLDPRDESWDYPWLKVGSFVMGRDYNIYRVSYNHKIVPVTEAMGYTRIRRLRALIPLRDAAHQLLEANKNYDNDLRLQSLQRRLSETYRDYVRRFDPLNSRGTAMAMGDDPDLAFLQSLEIYDGVNEVVKALSSLFTERVIRPVEYPDRADSASDALILSLAISGTLDWPLMESLTERPTVDLQAELSELGLVYQLPGTETWQTATMYLSGHVRHKLEIARQHQMDRNIEALEAVIPTQLKWEEIVISLGVHWVPVRIYNEFAGWLFNASPSAFKFKYIRELGKWNIALTGWQAYHIKNSIEVLHHYGTDRVNGIDLLNHCMQGLKIRIYDINPDTKERIFNATETLQAQQKQKDIHEKWVEWLNDQPGYQQELTVLYNDEFNGFVPPVYDGSHLRPHGLSPNVQLYQHQKNNAWRILANLANGENHTLLAHAVGAGKTILMVTASMEAKRMKLVNKPMHVVQKATLGGYEADFRRAFPGASLLVIDSDALNDKQRTRTLNMIATTNYDAIIASHDAFESIPLSAQTLLAYSYEKLAELERALEELKATAKGTISIKRMENAKKRLAAKIKKQEDTLAKRHDQGVLTWESLGIDLLFADEAHRYKNLEIITAASNVPGISTTSSARPADFYLKSRNLAPGHLIISTATPIVNSICEIYVMQKYLQPKTLEAAGIEHFDAWRVLFGEVVTGIELDPTGQRFRIHDRFKRLHNVPELLRMFWQVASIELNAKDLGLILPDHTIMEIVIEPSEIQKLFFEGCVERAARISTSKVDPKEDNMLKIISDASTFSLYPPFYDDIYLGEDGKLLTVADNIARIYHETTNVTIPNKKGKHNLAQFVFCDLGTPTPERKVNAYSRLKELLIERGVKANEIEFIQDHTTKAARNKVIEAMNEGRVRITMGGSNTLGTGVNAQRLAIASHFLTVPWVPAYDRQAAGRMVRQGNLNPKVTSYRYLTNTSLDGYRLQLCENKAAFIGQFLHGDLLTRTVADIDEINMDYATMKAAIAGDPMVMEQVKLSSRLAELESLHYSWLQSIKSQDMEIRLKQRLINAANADHQALTRLKEQVEKDEKLSEMHTLAEKLDGLCADVSEQFEKVKIAMLYGCEIYYDNRRTEITEIESSERIKDFWNLPPEEAALIKEAIKSGRRPTVLRPRNTVEIVVPGADYDYSFKLSHAQKEKERVGTNLNNLKGMFSLEAITDAVQNAADYGADRARELAKLQELSSKGFKYQEEMDQVAQRLAEIEEHIKKNALSPKPKSD